MTSTNVVELSYIVFVVGWHALGVLPKGAYRLTVAVDVLYRALLMGLKSVGSELQLDINCLMVVLDVALWVDAARVDAKQRQWAATAAAAAAAARKRKEL